MDNPFSVSLEPILDSLRSLCREKKSGDLSYVLKETEHLIEYGEPKVALENMCENLFELRIQITPRIFEAIRDLAQEMGIQERRFGFLAKLIDEPGKNT